LSIDSGFLGALNTRSYRFLGVYAHQPSPILSGENVDKVTTMTKISVPPSPVAELRYRTADRTGCHNLNCIKIETYQHAPFGTLNPFRTTSRPQTPSTAPLPPLARSASHRKHFWNHKAPRSWALPSTRAVRSLPLSPRNPSRR